MTGKETIHYNNEPEYEYTSLAVKIFSDFCCNGCYCTSDSDHKSY